MTAHNDMGLHHIHKNIADGTGVRCVCGYISFGTNCTLYLI